MPFRLLRRFSGKPVESSSPRSPAKCHRSIWSGAISFGLVNVPVKLYSAVSRKSVRFHQLHDKDGVRIQQKRVCPARRRGGRLRAHREGLRDQPGPLRRDRARGAGGARSRRRPARSTSRNSSTSTRSTRSTTTIPTTSRPDTGAAKAYRAPARGDARDEQGGDRPSGDPPEGVPGRDPARQRQRALRWRRCSSTTRWCRVTDRRAAASDDVEATEREVEMAQQLIELALRRLRPEKYHDDYREQVLELIEARRRARTSPCRPLRRSRRRCPT